MCGEVGAFFREEMPAVDRLACDLIGPAPPQAQRPAIRFIPTRECALAAPQCKDRAGDAAAGVEIRLIIGAVDRGGGAIFLADGVDVRGLAQGLDISLPEPRGEAVGRRLRKRR